MVFDDQRLLALLLRRFSSELLYEPLKHTRIKATYFIHLCFISVTEGLIYMHIKIFVYKWKKGFIKNNDVTQTQSENSLTDSV